MLTAYLLFCFAIFFAMVVRGIYEDQRGENAAEIGSNMTSPIFWLVVALVSTPFINIGTFIIACVAGYFILKSLHEDDNFHD